MTKKQTNTVKTGRITHLHSGSWRWNAEVLKSNLKCAPRTVPRRNTFPPNSLSPLQGWRIQKGVLQPQLPEPHTDHHPSGPEGWNFFFFPICVFSLYFFLPLSCLCACVCFLGFPNLCHSVPWWSHIMPFTEVVCSSVHLCVLIHSFIHFFLRFLSVMSDNSKSLH